MKVIVGFFMLLLASESFASVSGLSCSVSGNDVVNAGDISSRHVGTVTPVTLTAILKEDDGDGTYMTYVKINISFSPSKSLPLTLAAVTSFSDVLSSELTGAYSAELKINSRAGRAPMNLKVDCRPETFAYLLNPEFDAQQDPLDAVQNAAFTLPKLLMDILSGVYYHSPTASESEFIAAHFCNEGDTEELFKDLKANRSYANLWRTSALGDHVLTPQNLRLEGAAIRWEQPQETAVCIRSHFEDSVDGDGMPYTVEICDEYRVDELAPLSLEIKNCENK